MGIKSGSAGSPTVGQESRPNLRARVDELEAELASLEYAISHDLRAPLRALDGFSQALEEDYVTALDGQGLDYLRRIRRASLKATQMVEGLLRLSRIGRKDLVLEPVDLSVLCLEVIHEIEQNHPDREIAWHVGPGVTVNADKQLLRTLVTELFENALRYTSGRCDAKVEFAAAPQPDGQAFFVRDNGIGFDAELASSLFRPFQKLDTSQGGVGIGLAVAKRIVARHGGTIWASSSLGGGATVHFTLGGSDA